jgi:opacity protein-like surface antigen
MANFGTMVLTNHGLALQNKAQTGIELHFTRVAIGDGIVSGNLIDLTELGSEKKSLSINLLETEGGLATLRVAFSNFGLTEGFYVREFGVFAQDPDIGEILYSVANAGAQADFLPPEGSNVVEEIFDVITVISNATNVTAEINESMTYVTQQQLNTDILAAGWDYYGNTDPKTVTGVVVKPFFRWVNPTTNILYLRNLINTAWITFMDLQTGTVLTSPLGVAEEFYDTELPPRYLWVNGCTIGDESSGANGRANADTINLYRALWKSANNGGQIKLYNSAGIAVAKGASATEDFAAHKRVSLPDKRGRTAIGLDNMGGASANVVINSNADILAGVGGEESHTLILTELPQGAVVRAGMDGVFDNHSVTQDPEDATYNGGGGQSHNNMPPWVDCNYIMRY